MDLEVSLLKKQFSYDSVEVFDHGGNTVFSFKNVFINKNKKDPIHFFYGKNIVLYPMPHYFHFIKELIGGFIYYKNNIDESVNAIWLSLNWQVEKFHNTDKVNKEMYNILKNQFNINEISLDKFYNDGVFIEELIITYEVGQFLVNTIFPNFMQENITNVPDVRDFLKNLMIDDPEKPKKIFISRKNVSNVLKENNRLDSFSRYTEPWVEDMIENHFKNNGYEIIDLSGLSLYDQVSYFYNATHIAGLMGAGFINGIFSRDNTKFICLRWHEWFYYPYESDISSVINATYTVYNLFNNHTEEDLQNSLNSIDLN